MIYNNISDSIAQAENHAFEVVKAMNNAIEREKIKTDIAALVLKLIHDYIGSEILVLKRGNNNV